MQNILQFIFLFLLTQLFCFALAHFYTALKSPYWITPMHSHILLVNRIVLSHRVSIIHGWSELFRPEVYAKEIKWIKIEEEGRGSGNGNTYDFTSCIGSMVFVQTENILCLPKRNKINEKENRENELKWPYCIKS